MSPVQVDPIRAPIARIALRRVRVAVPPSPVLAFFEELAEKARRSDASAAPRPTRAG